MLEATQQGKAAMADLVREQRKANIVEQRDGGLQAGPGTFPEPHELSAHDSRIEHGRLTEGRASYGAHYGSEHTASTPPEQTSETIAEASRKHDAGIHSGFDGKLAQMLGKHGMEFRRGA